MLRRTLASVFLLTLLLAQAAPGLCQLRCDRQRAAAPMSSCHAMTMQADTFASHLAAPCAAQPCSSDHPPLAAVRQSTQPLLTTLRAEAHPAIHTALPASLASLRAESPPGPSLLRRTIPAASSPKTALRV